MKPLPSLIAVAVASTLSTAPAITLAQDDMEDLEVTMEVVDDAAELDDVISGTRGPDANAGYDDEDDGAEEQDADDGVEGGSGVPVGVEGNEFEQDDLEGADDDIEDSDEDFNQEDQFLEGEEVEEDAEFDAMEDDLEEGLESELG